MPAPTTVRALRVEPLDIPLREPFGIARGALPIAQNLLVALELGDGTRGFGEAAPFPAFNGETQDSARAAIEVARPLVEGADVRSWRRIASAVAEVVHSGSPRCAIETAVLDALTRAAGMPLWAFFGGATTELSTDVTIPTGSVERAREAAADIARRGFSTIKVKIGGTPRADDVERLLAVHDAAPGCSLIVDGNGAFTAWAALTLVAELRRRELPIVLLEQPVPGDDLEGLAEVTREAKLPVAADESVTSARAALEIARRRAASVLNVKPMKCGIAEALDIVAIARSAGLGLMIGGMVESVLAMTTSACLAGGVGGFAFVDLDTPLFLASNPFEGGYRMEGERIELGHIRAGHGVTPAA